MPVAQVVTPLLSGAREIRDLVVLVAGSDKAHVHGEIAPAFGLLAGEETRPFAAQEVHLRAFVDFEQIQAQVIGLERDRLFERAPEARLGLARDRQHEIDREILESGLPRLPHHPFGARRIVPAPDQSELAIRERLHPDREPVDAGGAQRSERRRVEIGGVRFGRDLGLRGDREDAPREPRGRRRSPPRRAAKACRRRRRSSPPRGRGAPSSRRSRVQRGEEEVDLEAVLPDAVEVAVAALRAAERNVEVEPERRAHADSRSGRLYSARSSARSVQRRRRAAAGQWRCRYRRARGERKPRWARLPSRESAARSSPATAALSKWRAAASSAAPSASLRPTRSQSSPHSASTVASARLRASRGGSSAGRALDERRQSGARRRRRRRRAPGGGRNPLRSAMVNRLEMLLAEPLDELSPVERRELRSDADNRERPAAKRARRSSPAQSSAVLDSHRQQRHDDPGPLGKLVDHRQVAVQ